VYDMHGFLVNPPRRWDKCTKAAGGDSAGVIKLDELLS